MKTKFASLADDLDACERLGAATDAPEGTRYIKLSDTLAKQISAALRGEWKEPVVARCVVCDTPAEIQNPPAAYVCPACIVRGNK